MTEDQESKELQADGGSKGNLNRLKDKKVRTKPLTKIILRRLPPTMTEEDFHQQVSPIPEHDYLYFAKPDPTLSHCGFSRAYINFINVEDIYLFKDKFDGYIFVDDKGLEYTAIVEYAPFQRVPKRRKKKDPKCGTIESDPIYQEFLESLNEPDSETREPKLEYSYQVNDKNDKKESTTPLLEYLAARKQDKKLREERRRRENDKRKMRIERKPKESPIKEENDLEDFKDTAKDMESEYKLSKKKFDVSEASDSKINKVQRRPITYQERKKKDILDKKEFNEDVFKKDRKDKFKEFPKDLKSKKYSDSRKERLKQNEQKIENVRKSDNADKTNDKSQKNDKKVPKINPDDIKPFTQLPQIKTDDLVKVIEEMDRKMKLGDTKEIEIEKENNSEKSEENIPKHMKTKEENRNKEKVRRSSLDSSTPPKKEEELELKRQKSMVEREKSTDTEDSIEKGDSTSDKRRIRNKDRPSLVIYQPGMGKFSKQRITRDKETNDKAVPDTENRDT